MPSWVLSISKDGEPTNYLPGQCVSMLSHPHSKNSFLMFRGNLCFSLYPLSLILSLDTAFSLHPPFRHLYTLMRSLWALFSLRWTVPALPDLLQYLSQSQLPFAGLHPVVSFLLYWEAQNQSQKKKFKYSFLTIISSAGVRQIFSTMVQNDVLDHPFCTSSHLPPYWQPTLHRGNTSLPFPGLKILTPLSQAKCSDHYWGTKSPHADIQVMASSSGGQSREVTWAWLQKAAADKGAHSWARLSLFRIILCQPGWLVALHL